MKKVTIIFLLSFISLNDAKAQSVNIELIQNAHDDSVFYYMEKQNFYHSEWQLEKYDTNSHTKLYSHFDLDKCNISSKIYGNLLSIKMKKLIVSEANKNVAYLLMQGNKWKGLLNKGIKYNGTWDWTSNSVHGGADITPFIVKDLSKGLSIHDFCLDPKNENHLFIALGDANEYYTSLVMYSDDGGETWKDMSEGIIANNVKLIFYEKGINERLFAITDNGNYIWDIEISKWEKYKIK